MSKVVHPFAHRLGVIRDWRHRWFATGPAYQEHLKTGVLLREFLQKELKGMYVGGIELERGKQLRIIIKTSRPGLIIGRSGEGSTKLRNTIAKFLKKKGIEGLEKRMPFRRVLKQTIEKVMANRDVKGVRVTLSGMLGGGSMSRTETLK